MTRVVELYAGPGGWGEALAALAVHGAVGIDIDPWACATAEAAGHKRVQADVSMLDPRDFGPADGLIAAPPCQPWSMAGDRKAEPDRARVHALVEAYAAGGNDPGADWLDDRSHHAAQPVRWVRDLRPEWVAMEQVPPVLSLWRHVGRVLERWGYSVWVGLLEAADFGVPQTRRRAVLMASRVRPIGPPAPTHARVVPGELPLFGEALLPWVSMAEALGWAGTMRSANYTNGTHEWYVRDTDRPSPTVKSNTDRWKVRSAFGQPADDPRNGDHEFDPGARPAHTVTGKTRSWALVAGKQDNSTVRSADEPAPTVAFGKDMASWRLVNGNRPNACECDADEPAGTLFFGARQNDVRITDGLESRRIAVAEAAILQSFRPDYPWQGSKTRQFQQVGNATPPLLALAVLRSLIGDGL